MTAAADETRCRVAILISGSGTNLQAFIDRHRDGELDADLVVVASNRADAYGLQRAVDAGIDTLCISLHDFDDREAFDRALAAGLGRFEPDLLILAGFMRILSPWFVQRFEGRILNIHPALLPKYPGLDTHTRALAAGDKHHGSTVHFVTEELDGGPGIVAGRLEIRAGDTADSLQSRVQRLEHRLYPMAAQWFATGRVRYRDGAAWLDGEKLGEPVIVDY